MISFRVRAGTADLPVKFAFATPEDEGCLALWRAPHQLRNNPHVQDALEYSRLANKRWKSYKAVGRVAASLEEVRRSIQKDPQAEVVFLMLARALWHRPSRVLGFCFCRRTWTHHILLDFAAVHPDAIAPAHGAVRGLGAGMLYSLVKIADELGVKTVWGEATQNSAGFYEKILGLDHVTDHFFIRDGIFQHCLQQFELVVHHDPS
jgi:hypothetical protein